MQIIINANNSVEVTQKFRDWASSEVAGSLARYAGKITRVEVHFNDTNSNKGGIDKYCSVEARVKGLKPLAVNHEAEGFDLALAGANDKLTTLLEHSIGKLEQKKGRVPMGGEPFADLASSESLDESLDTYDDDERDVLGRSG